MVDVGVGLIIPSNPVLETCLKTNADGGNKARFYVIKREPGAEMVNPYNEHHYVH